MVAGAAIAVQAQAQAQVFKWVDEKGRTHYGEKPPEGVKSSEVARPTPPSDPSKAGSGEDWRRKALEARRDKAERERGEQEGAAREAQERAQRERRCRNARVALDRLENVQGLYRYDERGGRVYITDAEREPEKARAQRDIREHCAG